MSLKFHTDDSSFYDKNGELFANPSETLEELEVKYQEAITKYREIRKISISNRNGYDRFDAELLRFNLCNLIENLEWKIDLKLLHLKQMENDCK